MLLKLTLNAFSASGVLCLSTQNWIKYKFLIIPYIQKYVLHFNWLKNKKWNIQNDIYLSFSKIKMLYNSEACFQNVASIQNEILEESNT